MMKDLQDIYDKFASTYEQNRAMFDMTEIINDFYDSLYFKKGNVLDLGCGAGEPFAKFFVEKGYQVTGVDFSEKMLEMANKYVPQMQTIHDDMTKVEFESNKFNVVTMIYSLFHLKNDEQFELLNKIYNWLSVNGSVLFTYATKEYTSYDEFENNKEFLGESLFYAHKTPKFLKSTLENIGYKNIVFTYREIAGETFLWVKAQK